MLGRCFLHEMFAYLNTSFHAFQNFPEVRLFRLVRGEVEVVVAAIKVTGCWLDDTFPVPIG